MVFVTMGRLGSFRWRISGCKYSPVRASAGQVRIAVSGTQRVAQFNTDADLLPELGIIVRGTDTLEAQDFLL